MVNRKNRKRLKNNNVSLISIDCLGGIVMHDLKMRFNTPTVNLWFYPADFVKMCNNLEYYFSLEPIFVKEEDINYPVGLIDDVKIYFTHYKDENEAKQKWLDRVKRVDYNNIVVLMTDANNCTESILHEFNKLKYPHVCFTHKKHKDICNTYYCKSNKFGFFHGYKPRSIKRYYDTFDFVEFFNGNK